MRLRLLTISLIALTGAAGWWYWARSDSNDHTGGDPKPLGDGQASVAKFDEPLPTGVIPTPPEKRPIVQRHTDPRTTTAAPTTAVTQPTSSSPKDSAEQALHRANALAAAARQWKTADYQRSLATGNADAEAYFQTYYYLRSCLRVARTPQDVERQMTQLDEWVERYPERFNPTSLERSLALLEQGFDRCENLQGDIAGLAVAALEKSADLDFFPAQIEYISAVPDIFVYQADGKVRDRIFRDPQLLVSYRERAAVYLSNAEAIPSSHVWYRVATIYREGFLAEPDLIRAYAYTHAAGLIAHTSVEDPWWTNELSAAQRREAEALAAVICGRDC